MFEAAARGRAAPTAAVQRPNSVLVSVSDTGGGIAAEFHQEIFEEFVRVDPSSSGMGLGLAITKRLIQAHRGKGLGGQRSWAGEARSRSCCPSTSSKSRQEFVPKGKQWLKKKKFW